jgi:DNA-binding transcriptional regulator YdaS (Cro superfamily)
MKIKKLIKTFGGRNCVARLLGLHHQAVAQWWLRRAGIPLRHWESLIKAAKDSGFELTPAQLMEINRDTKRTPKRR